MLGAARHGWAQMAIDGHYSGPGYCNLACCNMAKKAHMAKMGMPDNSTIVS